VEVTAVEEEEAEEEEEEEESFVKLLSSLISIAVRDDELADIVVYVTLAVLADVDAAAAAAVGSESTTVTALVLIITVEISVTRRSLRGMKVKAKGRSVRSSGRE